MEEVWEIPEFRYQELDEDLRVPFMAQRDAEREPAAPPIPQPIPDDDESIQTILQCFPDASPIFVRNSLRQFGPADCVERVCDLMLNKGYEKIEKGKPPVQTADVPAETATDFKDTSKFMSADYRTAAFEYLKNLYPVVSVVSLRNALMRSLQHLYPAMELMKRSVSGKGEGDKIIVKYNKTRRTHTKGWVPHCSDPIFMQELDWIRSQVTGAQEDSDHKLAEQLNEEMYEVEGQNISCMCCFGDYPFEAMVQCTDGHLFCVECLRRFAQERLFGENRTDLTCMGTEEACAAQFPRSQLQKAMTDKMWQKYEELEQEQAVSRAEIDGLESCPFCPFKAVVTNPDDKVFHCLKCLKDSCRLCHEESHIPLRCEEVEKKGETNLRLHVEQKMTEALLRECPKCHAKFFKEEGCNKMTCSCGQWSCYMCREPIEKKVGYGHFCQHAWSPGKGCSKKGCNKCPLWSKDTVKDDALMVEKRAREAEEQFKKEHADEKVKLKVKPGGEQPAKRARVDHQPADGVGVVHELITAIHARQLWPLRQQQHRGRHRGYGRR